MQDLTREEMSDCKVFDVHTDPWQTGHGANSRKRVYQIGYSETACKVLGDPCEFYVELCKDLQKQQVDISGAYFETSEEEFQAEKQSMTSEYRHGPENDFYDTLTEFEKTNYIGYRNGWKSRTGQEWSSDNPNIVCVLGQNPKRRWSATSVKGRLPGLMHASSNRRIWSGRLRRWLLAKEKLGIMGWPVLPEVAQAYGTRILDWRTLHGAHELIGNGMHVPNLLLVMVSALACASIQKGTGSVPRQVLRTKTPLSSTAYGKATALTQKLKTTS